MPSTKRITVARVSVDVTPGEWVSNRRVALVFAVLLAVSGTAAVGGSSVSGASDGFVERADRDAVAASEAAVQDDQDRGNDSESGDEETAVAHRNPDEVEDRDNVSDTRIWLSREMSERLVESADVSREDRERARELIGNDSEYAELAEQYASVSGEGTAESEAFDGDPVGEVGRLQREFFAEVELYRQTHGEYRDAREANETLRTRRLAHELERRADRINRTANRLNESYADVSSLEPAERRNVTRTIGEMRSNVTRTQQSVRNRTLVRTELSVEATDSGGSFVDPVSLRGRLRTADGDPVSDENVSLRVGNRTLDATTDGDGRFGVEYRPTLAPAGDASRSVEFRPANESVYARDDATVGFEVRRVAPNVTVANRSSPVRYDDAFSVEGDVTGDGVGVPDVPVAVTVDGVPIAQTRTDGDGSFDATGRLPANVSTGDRRVTVALALENATSRAEGPVALAPANATATVTVEETPTSLSTTDVRTYNETAFVAGRLTTEDGDPLPNRTVDLLVDGRTVGNATTNATGGFATTATVPREATGDDSTVDVAVAFSPSGGNVAPARATATATFDASDAVFPANWLGVGIGGLLGVAVLSVFVWRFRSDGSERTPEADATDRPTPVGDADSPSAARLLDSAASALDDGAFDAAVVTAYAAARDALSAPSEPGTATGGSVHRTHWEFYSACRDDGLSERRLESLETLTEAYERAAFAPHEVPPDVASDAVAAATALDSDDGSDSTTRVE